MTQKMKTISLIGFSLIFLLLLFVNQQFKGNEKLYLSEISLQNGDLIFRRGRSLESQAVLISDYNSRFSHVGIIYIDNKIPYVIHAVPGEINGKPDFIKKEKLTDFLTPEKAADFALYRSDFDIEKRDSAALNALAFFQKNLVFDSNYNLDTNDQLYCTELVMKAFEKAVHHSLNFGTTRLNLLFRKVNVLMPGNIISNPHFNPIINN